MTVTAIQISKAAQDLNQALGLEPAIQIPENMTKATSLMLQNAFVQEANNEVKEEDKKLLSDETWNVMQELQCGPFKAKEAKKKTTKKKSSVKTSTKKEKKAKAEKPVKQGKPVKQQAQKKTSSKKTTTKKCAAPKKEKPAKAPRDVGIHKTIYQMLLAASQIDGKINKAAPGLTQKEIHQKLVKQYPDRDPLGLRKTISLQVGWHLKNYKGIDVRVKIVEVNGKRERRYHIATNKKLETVPRK